MYYDINAIKYFNHLTALIYISSISLFLSFNFARTLLITACGYIIGWDWCEKEKFDLSKGLLCILSWNWIVFFPWIEKSTVLEYYLITINIITLYFPYLITLSCSLTGLFLIFNFLSPAVHQMSLDHSSHLSFSDNLPTCTSVSPIICHFTSSVALMVFYICHVPCPCSSVVASELM